MPVPFPSLIPSPTLRGTSVTIGSNVKRRQTQSGQDEVRNFGWGAPDSAILRFVLTRREYEVFIEFYNLTASMGENWFSATWLHHFCNPARFLTNESSKYDIYARFAGKPKVQAYGTMYRIVTVPVVIGALPNVTTYQDIEYPDIPYTEIEEPYIERPPGDFLIENETQKELWLDAADEETFLYDTGRLVNTWRNKSKAQDVFDLRDVEHEPRRSQGNTGVEFGGSHVLAGHRPPYVPGIYGGEYIYRLPKNSFCAFFVFTLGSKLTKDMQLWGALRMRGKDGGFTDNGGWEVYLSADTGTFCAHAKLNKTINNVADRTQAIGLTRLMPGKTYLYSVCVDYSKPNANRFELYRCGEQEASAYWQNFQSYFHGSYSPDPTPCIGAGLAQISTGIISHGDFTAKYGVPWDSSWQPRSQNFAFPFTGTIHEILLFSKAMTAKERHRLEAHLAYKWDYLLQKNTLVNALPEDHPFKHRPPNESDRG